MKNKIMCIAFAVIIIASLIVTATVGLRVTSRYAEGYLIRFSCDKTINLDSVSEVAKEVLLEKVVFIYLMNLFLG